MRMPVALTPSGRSRHVYQDAILQKVSRTFALTIPLLPQPLREVVTNAYLLCRIADTIEDESALSVAQKQYFHDFFLGIVTGDRDADGFAEQLVPLLATDALDAERDLVGHTRSVIAVTCSCNANQRAALARCLAVMCHGMPCYERHASLAGLPDQPALDDYCYCVAGVVGEMLTRLFCDHCMVLAPRCEPMMRLGVSFGQGLQMVNILKDFWEDHDRGVCWLPRDLFAHHGIELARVTPDRYEPGFGTAYAQLIGLAHQHLRRGIEYTLMIPDTERGIRQFCLLALALAVQTLQRIHEHPDFTNGREVKVSHRVVANTLMLTHLFAGYDRAVRRWFERLGKGLPEYEAGPVSMPRLRGAS